MEATFQHEICTFVCRFLLVITLRVSRRRAQRAYKKIKHPNFVHFKPLTALRRTAVRSDAIRRRGAGAISRGASPRDHFSPSCRAPETARPRKKKSARRGRRGGGEHYRDS